MAELADALDLGSSGVTRGGSTPSIRTMVRRSREQGESFAHHALSKALIHMLAASKGDLVGS